jgi:lysophospholipase L1-like esterase
LSAKSYPLLLSHDLFSAAGGHSVACSGAVINDIAGTGDSYRGQVQHGSSLGELETAQSGQLNSILAGYSPGYVPQQLFVKQYQPRVATVSVGGNDIGFGDILQECVVPHISRHASDGTCYNTYESRQEVVNLVNRTVPRWIALYRQLQAASPGTTIYAIGYPSIASDTGTCPLNVNLGKSELEFAEELIHYLNGAVQQAAVAAGVPYVDISQALAGHRLCEASGSGVAVNGLTAGNDFGAFGVNVLGRESYHPNALGHELIEQAILRQTNNLSVAASGQGATANDSQSLLNVPKSGRLVNTLVPDIVTSQLLRPGTSAAVQVNGTRDGLRPNSTYTVRLDGPSGTVLASLPSDSNGNISGVATVPGGTTSGNHTIDATGSDQADEPIDVKQPVYVASGTGDTDGDGVTDANDSCPYAINSGQDFDRDGIDDVCDGVIGPAPAPTSLAQEGSVASPQQKAIPKPPSQPVQPVKGDADNQSDGQVLGASNGQSAKTFNTAQPSLIRNSIARLSVLPRRVGAGGRFAAYVLISILMLGLVFICYQRRIIKKCRVYLSAARNIWHKIDYKKSWPCFTIVIMRKFGVAVFSLVLFVSLLALAFSASSNIAFTHPGKLEKWLNDSNLYGAFVENAIDQAEQTAGTDQSGGISLSDSAVKRAAESSFSSAALQKDVNTFLDSNYAWLNGKTSKPSFSVDLSGAKQNFAQKVGDYVKTYLSTRPACTPAQAAQINPQTADPLTLNCLPPGVDPATVSAQVTEQIANSTEFLSDPVVTADNVNPNGSIGTPQQPYYQKFSSLPSAYQKATKIPWVAGALVIISLLAVIFIASRKRKGVKVITVVLALAGLVMVSTKFVSDQAFHSLEKHAFNASTVGELQKALTVFLRHAEDQLVKVNLWFGIGYLLLALVLLVVLVITRQRGLRIPKRLQSAVPAADLEPEPAAPTSATPKPPRVKKPSRLVQ